MRRPAPSWTRGIRSAGIDGAIPRYGIGSSTSSPFHHVGAPRRRRRTSSAPFSTALLVCPDAFASVLLVRSGHAARPSCRYLSGSEALPWPRGDRGRSLVTRGSLTTPFVAGGADRGSDRGA